MPLKVNWHAKATRFTLRLDAASGGARLTLPMHADLEDAIKFLKRHERWLIGERRKLLRLEEDQDDHLLPLRGEMHEVVETGSGTRRVWVEDGNEDVLPRLMISGPEDTAKGRMLRWLKVQAREDIQSAVEHHGAQLEVRHKTVSIRDQRSRWGSCSTTGTLSFSWRLIMAPRYVLDYVAAHEVAHLREMNHSKRFWAEVEKTYGDTTSPRKWLRKHGQGLHRFGR